MDAKGAAPSTPNSIQKSNSTKSAGARSTKSHESVNVLGVHPFGTLRVLGAGSSPRITEQVDDGDDDDDNGPPPLDPPAGDAYRLSGQASTSDQSSSTSPTRQRTGHQAHTMGGGDVAMILDLPDLFTVAYDALCITAKNFCGVRDIPSGPHFFWVSHPSGVAPRAGVWFLGSESRDQVHVVQWDKYNEFLTEPTRSEARNHAENLPNIHANMLPFPDPSAARVDGGQLPSSQIDANRSIWRQMTTHINTSVLDRITGTQAGGWLVHTLDRAQGSLQLGAELNLERAVPSNNLQQRDLHFTLDKTKRLFSLTSFGSERSLEATDPTTYLLSHIEDPNNHITLDDVVGEFQFSFIVGIHLGNEACIEQWWFMLLKILLKSHLLIEKQPVLVETMWHTVAAQLSYNNGWMETSLLDSSEDRCRELRIGLIIYKRRMTEFLQGDENIIMPDHLAVGNAFSRLEAVLTDMGWDLSGDYLRKGLVMMEDGEEVELELTDLEAEDERGEWAPEIVEFDENGRQRDLISWSN